ncbi:MAG: hypothetical protein OXQ96_00850 [Alphaproteobacteria bacterium]|nr:hypothetical protein [Alphaproteobacteria bacterium]
MSSVIPLGEESYQDIYRMMLVQGFPQTPASFKQAIPYFEQVDFYGVFNGGDLVVVFILGNRTCESAYLDVVCQPDWEGRWGNRRVLKELASIAFELWRLSFLWAHTYGSRALKASIKAGFNPVRPMMGKENVLILTPQAFEKKFGKYTREEGVH